MLQILNGSLPTLDRLPRKLAANSHTFARQKLMPSRSEHDQELDSLLVGPIPVGVNKFIFEADPPDLRRIPTSEILGVTVILLTCSYDGREFVRVGYYVNNEYDSEELNAEPPAKPDIDRVRRNVLAEKPRVTRFAIKWYVTFCDLRYLALIDYSTGTQKTQRQPNSPPSSLRPTLSKTTASTTVQKSLSSRKASRPSLRPKKPKLLQQAKMRRWAEPKELLAPRKKEMMTLMLAVKISKLKAVAARMKKLKRRRETMIWRWGTVSLLRGLALGSSSLCISNHIRRLWCIKRNAVS